MSNTSKGRGVKGSKFWMQMIPNTGLKEEFDKIIGEELEWISPLEGEEKLYEEYELGSKEMIKELEWRLNSESDYGGGIDEPE